MERVTAADLEPGDLFSEARMHPKMTLEAIESIGAKSRWLRVSYAVSRPGETVPIQQAEARIRPRHTKRFWRVVA